MIKENQKMIKSNTIKLEEELKEINQKIDDIKLQDKLDIKELKILIKHRDMLEFKLGFWT